VNTQKLRYMAAHVRLNSKANPSNWEVPDLVAAFCILPPPEVPFDVWQAMMGEPAQEQPVTVTPDAAIEHNSNVIGIVDALGPAQRFEEKK
jgi:hypothetical protein